MHLNRSRSRRWRVVSCIAASITLSASSPAQGYPFSQRATISQDVAFTHITVTYGRPVARGRTLFGRLVP